MLNETIRVVTNAFSDDTDNHGLTLVVINLDKTYAQKLVEAIVAFEQIYLGSGLVSGLGQVAEILIEDDRAIYTGMDEDEGLEDDFPGAFGLLKESVLLPVQNEQIMHSYLVVMRGHVMWQGRTGASSFINSQALPLDFLEVVAAGKRGEAERLAARRKRFDEEGRAHYYDA